MGMSWELMITKGMSTALVLLFFAAIIFLLRFLYGPKGRFRDPEWDRWNEEARIELEKKLDAKEDQRLRDKFEQYAESFFSGDEAHDRHLRLKIDHTFRVCEHAEELIAGEPDLSDPEISRALKLAALLHDVARFEQYTRYHTFADDLSRNHGAWGAKIIRQQNFLKNSPAPLQRLVLQAVALHNRFAVPDALSGKARQVLLGLRDADKLDILRIMEDHLKPGTHGDSVILLHLKDEPGSYSPPVLEALRQGRGALYKDMRFHNDFRILLCTWLFDLHFGSSLGIVKRAGHMDRVIDGLDALPDVQSEAREIAGRILSRVQTHQEAGAGFDR